MAIDAVCDLSQIESSKIERAEWAIGLIGGTIFVLTSKGIEYYSYPCLKRLYGLLNLKSNIMSLTIDE